MSYFIPNNSRGNQVVVCDCCNKDFFRWTAISRNNYCNPCERFRNLYQRPAEHSEICHGICKNCNILKKLGPDDICWKCLDRKRI